MGLLPPHGGSEQHGSVLFYLIALIVNSCPVCSHVRGSAPAPARESPSAAESPRHRHRHPPPRGAAGSVPGPRSLPQTGWVTPFSISSRDDMGSVTLPQAHFFPLRIPPLCRHPEVAGIRRRCGAGGDVRLHRMGLMLYWGVLRGPLRWAKLSPGSGRAPRAAGMAPGTVGNARLCPVSASPSPPCLSWLPGEPLINSLKPAVRK